MFKRDSRPDPRDVPPFGELEYGMTDEEIEENMREYAYIFDQLKKC